MPGQSVRTTKLMVVKEREAAVTLCNWQGLNQTVGLGRRGCALVGRRVIAIWEVIYEVHDIYDDKSSVSHGTYSNQTVLAWKIKTVLGHFKPSTSVSPQPADFYIVERVICRDGQALIHLPFDTQLLSNNDSAEATRKQHRPKE